MAIDNEKPREFWHYRKCPECKSKMHVERKYCVCGKNICREDIYKVDFKPAIHEQKNLDVSFYSCEKCGENCRYCASFACTNTNQKGFGGVNCKYRGSEMKCKCCQLMIKNSGRYDPIQAIKETVAAIQRIAENKNTGYAGVRDKTA